jgi:hypothetical protein
MNAITLLPRLPAAAAAVLLDEALLDGPPTPLDLRQDGFPENVTFAPTGGARCTISDLRALRLEIRDLQEVVRSISGKEEEARAAFDREVAEFLSQHPLLNSGEALRNDVWAFIAICLAPDVAWWRFGATHERYHGGIRNTFQRLWLRGRLLDRGPDHPQRFGLLEGLTEDALVQITERTSLVGDPRLAREIAEAWIRTEARRGRTGLEGIMRAAIIRVRTSGQIRLLPYLSDAKLADFLDECFEAAEVRLGASTTGNQ